MLNSVKVSIILPKSNILSTNLHKMQIPTRKSTATTDFSATN